MKRFEVNALLSLILLIIVLPLPIPQTTVAMLGYLVSTGPNIKTKPTHERVLLVSADTSINYLNVVRQRTTTGPEFISDWRLLHAPNIIMADLRISGADLSETATPILSNPPPGVKCRWMGVVW